MERELVTVIVPVYEVEKYLNRCLDSIVNQTYTNLEIILVDDGSPDRCPMLCDEWAGKDGRIRVIHKRNAGLGLARNTGLDHASGKYICFIDSDDYIALNTIEKAYESIRKHHSDMVIYGMYSVGSSGEIVSAAIPHTGEEYYSGDSVAEFILPNMLGADRAGAKKVKLNMSACARLYSMDLINRCGWRFVSERQYISEDYYSLLELNQYVESVSIIREALYYYRYNGESLTHTFDFGRLERACACHQGMTELYKKCGYPGEIKSCIDSQFLGSVIATMKLLVTSELDGKEKRREIRGIIADEYLQGVLRQMDIQGETFLRKVIIMALRSKCSALTYGLVSLKAGKRRR